MSDTYREFSPLNTKLGRQAALGRIETLKRQVATLRAQIVRYCADDPPHARECAIYDPVQHGPCDCGVEQWIEDCRVAAACE